MALTSYNDLRQAVIDWPDLRGEVDLESYIDTVISLAEARINREVRLEGHIVSLAVGGTQVDGYALPDDYTAMDRVTGPGGESLEYRPADELRRWGEAPKGPCFYSIDGRQLLFAPAVDGFNLRYFRRLGALQQSVSNWLFALAPDLYLYASLIEASRFSKESEQEFQRYEQSYQGVVQMLYQEDLQAQTPKSQPLRTLSRVGYKPRAN